MLVFERTLVAQHNPSPNPLRGGPIALERLLRPALWQAVMGVSVSYLVLARKYRPSSFADLIGQEHVVRTLSNAIRLNRVHHAFLFTGARGVGKTTTARVLAKALNCENGPTDSPCGVCSACVEITQGTSSDVLEIDGASNTGVDNVRELRENVKYLPSRGRYKLYIIDEVHMLSQAAFNALLKTLEEPPPHVKFIFATTEPHKIPITILSRCQRFDFRRVSVPQLADHLKTILSHENVALSAESLTAVVREAQGSVRDAMSLLDQVLSFAGDSPDDGAVLEALGAVDRQTIFELCDAVLGRNATRVLELVGEVDSRGHDLAEVAGLLVEHWRDLMVAKVVEEPSATLLERSPGEIDALAKQAAGLSTPQLHQLFRLMVGVAEDVARSEMARVTLEMGLLRLLEVEPAESLGTLLGKLDKLVSGAPIGAAQAKGMASAAVSQVPVAAKPRVVPAPEAVSAAPKPAQAPPIAPAKAEPPNQKQPPKPTSPATSAAVQGLGDDSGWGRFVARVRQIRPAMASVLEHGRPLSFGPDGVEVAYPPASFYMDSAREPEMLEVVKGALEAQFGQAVGYRVVALKADDMAQSAAPMAESIADATERRMQEHENKVREDALAHPAVRQAVSILGGEVREIRNLSIFTDQRGD